MTSTNQPMQYENFIEIWKGYQAKEQDIQPKVPHPHVFQHSMAIILRLRPQKGISKSVGKVSPYIPPVYKTELKMLSAVFNEKNVHGEEVQEQLTPCLIKLLPKIYQKEVISKTFFALKNRSVGYLPSKDLNDHFCLQNTDLNDLAIEYLILRRYRDSKDEEENETNLKKFNNNIFSGYCSFPGGVEEYGENGLDGVVRNTYEQTGIDLTDHNKYALIAQSSELYKMRYLPNHRVIAAKPFIFVQLVPEALKVPKIDTKIVSHYMWSHLEFLYKCELSKYLEYREVTTELLKRRLNHVKLAHIKIADADKYSLAEILRDPKKCEPMFSLCGVTLGMLMSLLEAAPNAYNKSKFSAAARKQFSIQLKRFNPEYLGALGDKISKYTAYKYLMNSDKKWRAQFREREAELTYKIVYPSIIATGTFLYLLGRITRKEQEPPKMAKI